MNAFKLVRTISIHLYRIHVRRNAVSTPLLVVAGNRCEMTSLNFTPRVPLMTPTRFLCCRCAFVASNIRPNFSDHASWLMIYLSSCALTIQIDQAYPCSSFLLRIHHYSRRFQSVTYLFETILRHLYGSQTLYPKMAYCIGRMSRMGSQSYRNIYYQNLVLPFRHCYPPHYLRLRLTVFHQETDPVYRMR